ncbi:2114_t:CDS:2, partial [Scutellospora calospora]
NNIDPNENTGDFEEDENIDATQSKNQVDDTRDQIFLNSEFDEDFDLARRNIHPADNTSAK